MKSLWKNPVIAFLSSLKLSAALMVLVAISSAKATFLESDYGREAAYDLVYAARWFEGLLILLTISLILLFFKRWPYRQRQWGFALVHVAMIVILVGAGVTRYFGYEGIMAIREGESVDYIYSDKAHLQAAIGQETGSFPVRLWKPGENSVWGSVAIGGEAYELGATGYWPRYAEGYQEGPGGVPALEFAVTRDGDITSDTLPLGRSTTINGVEVRFLSGDFTGEMSNSPRGDLRLHIADQTCTFPVALPGGEPFRCGDYSFEVVEFTTSFRVGADPVLDGPLTNPMVKVRITGPDGASGERMLFALHPDFSMGHSGNSAQFEDLDMLYQVSMGLELSSGGETGIRGRASFPLQTMDMESELRGEIPAGQVFPVRESMLYLNDGSDFSFVAVDVMQSAVLGPVQTEDQNARPAARMVIRDGQGNQAEAIVRKDTPGEVVDLGGKSVRLTFAPVIVKLPYSVHLDDFVLQTYPGSDNPATYESYVSLSDPDKGIQGEKVHVYMNHPMVHRGSKHFQSSYDPDRKGTVLSVNHDPGKLPTYIGYSLISLGFLLILFKEVSVLLKDLMAVDKHKGKETAVKSLLVALMAAAALGLAAPSALAQAHDPNDGQDHTGHNHGPATTGFVTLSDPAREAASRLIIQDFRGRMKPLDTLARETVMKVAKRSKYEGREPVDQYLSWSLNPNHWWDKPLIGVRYPGVKDVLGVDHSVKNVSAASLFDSQGRYKLAALVEEAHRTPDRDRTKTQRQLISFDERFQILYMTFQGSMLKLFPIPGDPNHKWDTFDKVESRLDPEQAMAYSAAYDALAGGVQGGDNGMITGAVAKIHDLQARYGAQVIPSRMRIDSELTYNRSHIFSWMMVPLLCASFVLMVVFFWRLFRGSTLQASFRNPFYSLGVALYTFAFAGMIYAYVLRWVASGRAPLSNGHESLLFISLAAALAGLLCEFAFRLSAPGSLGSLLTVVILGVSMLSTFDPAIGPLVPVLVSYWLNIHVTIITASYGFLGLSALLGALVLILIMFKSAKKENLHEAVKILDRINRFVLVAGLGLLTVGTLLGGVWANESWGRYWGWDAKETWSLITILVYAVVLHFRWIPATRSIWLNSAGSLAAVSSVVMTYFGVNYFLSGLHSYAQGDAAKVPDWVYIFAGVIIAMIALSGYINRSRPWGAKA